MGISVHASLSSVFSPLSMWLASVERSPQTLASSLWLWVSRLNAPPILHILAPSRFSGGLPSPNRLSLALFSLFFLRQVRALISLTRQHHRFLLVLQTLCLKPFPPPTMVAGWVRSFLSCVMRRHPIPHFPPWTKKKGPPLAPLH